MKDLTFSEKLWVYNLVPLAVFYHAFLAVALANCPGTLGGLSCVVYIIGLVHVLFMWINRSGTVDPGPSWARRKELARETRWLRTHKSAIEVRPSGKTVGVWKHERAADRNPPHLWPLSLGYEAHSYRMESFHAEEEAERCIEFVNDQRRREDERPQDGVSVEARSLAGVLNR